VKVLVAVDQSDCSKAAVSSVLDRSWPSGTTFEVIHVVEPLAAQYALADARSLRAMLEADQEIFNCAQELINEKTFQLAAIFGKDRVSGQVIEGHIAESIVAQAKIMQADLIVMGSHGRTGFDRIFLGSIAGKVAGQAPCSIEIVKQKMTDDDKQVAAGKTAKKTIMEAHH
jgi:nucleotide-binding universal stress UspA family protein